MRRPRIRTQAYLVGAVPLAFLLVLLALALLIQANSRAAAVSEQRTEVVLAHADDIRIAIDSASRAASSPKIATSKERLARARVQIAAHLRSLDSLVADDPGMPTRLAALRNALDAGLKLLDAYAALLRAHDTAGARRLADAPSTRALSLRLTTASDNFVSHERRNELTRLAQMRAASDRYGLALIAACVLGILVTLLVSGRFGLEIAMRLGLLAENARRLVRGEVTAPLRGNDEFTDLDVVYQAMMRRIQREHKIAATLQRTLLPQVLPAFDGIRIDTAYVPAARETEIGGDWYDAFTVSDHCVCISIGDVAGHGLRAATIMAGARLSVRTAARMQPDPALIMAHLNRVLCADEPGTLVTALIAMFDIEDGSLRYAVAGHPEPLVIRPDGEYEFLGGRGLLLGVDENVTYETFSTRLREGWALLLYTDGLVEVAHDYFTGLDDLCAAASEEFTSASENIAEAIQERVMAGRSGDDDAAALFIGVTRLGAQAPHPQLRKWTLDARDAQSAHRAKRAILWHLGDQIRDKDELSTVELILGELIGNVARHSPGVADVTVELQRAMIVLQVSDRGRPFPFDRENGEAADLLAENGRGLFLVRAMSRDLRVEHTGTGNVVTAVLAQK